MNYVHIAAIGQVALCFFYSRPQLAWLWAHEGHVPLPTRGAQVDIEKGQITLSSAARDALDVQTVEVASRLVPEKLLAYVALVPRWDSHAFATTRLSGRVSALKARPGQAVQAGEVLAEVTSVALEALQLDLLNLQNDLRLSKQILQRYEDSPVAFSERDVAEAMSRNLQQRIGFEVAKRKWHSLGLEQESLDALLGGGKRAASLPVRSPIAGTVIHADLGLGRVVEPAEHLFEIVNLESVWAKIGVLEKDIGRVEVGQAVELRLTGFPGEVFPAPVQVKGLHLDPRTHLNTVWAELPNPPGLPPRLLPGMTGQTHIIMAGRPSAKAVPQSALINNGVDRFVFVELAHAASTSQYQRTSVTVIRETPDWVEIEAGSLLPGDRVVVQGAARRAFASTVLRLSPEMIRTIDLRVEPVRNGAVDDVLTLQGAVDLSPDRRAVASVALAGTLERIRFRRGEKVQAGQVLAEVASLDFANLQLELLKSHLELQFLDEQYDRVKRIQSAFSERRLLELDSARNASRNRRDSLGQQLQVLGLTDAQVKDVLERQAPVPNLPVRAPIAGHVVTFEKVLGQAVKADETFVEVQNLSQPWIQGYLSERDQARVRVGQRARLRMLGTGADLFKGTVVRSGQVFVESSGVLSVWIELDRYPAHTLRHGQLAEVTALVGEATAALTVPLKALAREGPRAYVFVEKADGTFERRLVSTGRTDDLGVAITSGLQPGEMIAITAAAELQSAYASIR